MNGIITSFLIVLTTSQAFGQWSVVAGSDFYVLTTFKHGRDKVQREQPFPWHYYEAQNITAPSLNISYTKMKSNGLGLGINTGLSYYGTKAVIDYSYIDEYYSELKLGMVNMPLTFRVSADLSRLIEQSFYMELGVMNTWLVNYQLKELASIKTLDSDNEVIGETFYQSDQRLSTKPFYRVMPMWGLGLKVRRLHVGFSGAFTVFDWYKPLTSTDVPEEYSMYSLMHQEKGKFKFNYMSIFVGFRLTKH